MTIEEAYKILRLGFGANEEEINKQYKALGKVYHPDKGGNNSTMADLNSAKEIAISFVTNKEIYSIAIRQVKDLIITERALQTLKEDHKSESQILYKRLSNKGGIYKSLKAVTVSLGIIAGIFVVLQTYIIPIYQQQAGQDASKSMITWILLIGAICTVIFIIISSMETKMKDRIETFKVNLDDKKTIAKLIFEILYFHQDSNNINEVNVFNETWFQQNVSDWLGNGYSRDPFLEVAQLVLPSADRNSTRSIARQMGMKDFTQLILIKGQEKDLLQEIETDIAEDEIRYRITNEMEKLKNNHQKKKM